MHGVIGYSREGLDWCSRGWMFCLTFGASLGDAAGPGAASSEPLRSAHQMPLSTRDRRSSGDSVCRRTAISLGCRSHLNAGCETQNLLNSGPKHVPASYLRRSAWVATGDRRSDAGLNFQQARQARPHRSRGRHTRSAQPSRHSSRVILSEWSGLGARSRRRSRLLRRREQGREAAISRRRTRFAGGCKPRLGGLGLRAPPSGRGA